jgi:adenylate kinase
VRTRLKVYHDQTAPLVDFYQSQQGEGSAVYSRVEGVGSVDDIKAKVIGALKG